MAPKPGAGDPSGPGKRKGGPAGGNSNTTGRGEAFAAKRAKVFAARNIPTQPARVALKDGELDLAAFVAAHEFEIRALEQSMATTKAVSCSRAFQAVPRGLRRRTASHNPKRVPKRLRARARREMEEDNAPLVEARRRRPRTLRGRIRAQARKRLYLLAARKSKRKAKRSGKDGNGGEDDANGGGGGGGGGKVGKGKAGERAVGTRKQRPKIRRNVLNEPPKPPAKFRKRQINKTWLPTHRWHAKRARMTPPQDPLWRFAIPLTPNEKIYRPTHRAQGEKGALIWDMSYMSTIGVYGNTAGMERVLRRIGMSQESCWNERGSKWRQGTRAWTGMLSTNADGVQRCMCPATVIWNPRAEITSASTEGEQQQQQQQQQQQGRQKKPRTQSQVFVRLHPSAFLEVFNELLRLTKMENPRLYIEDLRFEIGSIDLSGPASTEALLAVLTPYPSLKNKHSELFRSLRGLSNPSALPANAILHFPIQDPRLRYPPRKSEPPTTQDPAAHMALLETIAHWPAEQDLTPSPLFDRHARHAASCLHSQKSINRRRSKATPGTFLKPITASASASTHSNSNSVVDPPIPIALLSSRCGSHTQTQGTWTLLAPWSCILPLWYSLVHVPLTSGSNPRFAGLDQIAQVSFERGLPSFPADYPGTRAGRQWETQRAQRRRWQWARRPKSKRTAWETLDLGAGRKGELGDGLSCDFRFLFHLAKGSASETEAAVESDAQKGAPPDSAGDAMDIDSQAPAPAPAPEKDTATNTDLPSMTHISRSAFTALIAHPQPSPPLPPQSIICVRISLLGRGIARPCARIYRLPSPSPSSTPLPSPTPTPLSIPAPSSPLPHDLRAQWLARIPHPPPHPSSPSSPTPPHRISQPSSAHLKSRRALLARELALPPPSNALYPRPNQHSIDGTHPLVPHAGDLIGFITTGGFSMAHGAGRAVGSISLEKVLPDLRGANDEPTTTPPTTTTTRNEARLCVVRNAGENVGWLARWEVI